MHTMRTPSNTLDDGVVNKSSSLLFSHYTLYGVHSTNTVRFLLIGNHHFLRQSIFLEHFSWHNNNDDEEKKRTKQLSRISERENDGDGGRETVVIFSWFWCFIKPMYFLTFFYFVLDTTMESQKREKQPLEFRHFRFLSVREYARVWETSWSVSKGQPKYQTNSSSNQQQQTRKKQRTGTLDTKRNKWIQSKSKTSVSFPSDLKVFQLMRLILWSCCSNRCFSLNLYFFYFVIGVVVAVDLILSASFFASFRARITHIQSSVEENEKGKHEETCNYFARVYASAVRFNLLESVLISTKSKWIFPEPKAEHTERDCGREQKNDKL